jgi:hypothetical protein
VLSFDQRQFVWRRRVGQVKVALDPTDARHLGGRLDQRADLLEAIDDATTPRKTTTPFSALTFKA